MRRIKNIFMTGVVMSIAVIMPTFSSFAGEWEQNSAGWYYRNSDSGILKNDWQWIDGNGDGISEYYYFDSEGYLIVDSTTPDGFLVDANGARIENGQIKTKKADEIVDNLDFNPAVLGLMGQHISEVKAAKGEFAKAYYGQRTTSAHYNNPYIDFRFNETGHADMMLTSAGTLFNLHEEISMDRFIEQINLPKNKYFNEGTSCNFIKDGYMIKVGFESCDMVCPTTSVIISKSTVDEYDENTKPSTDQPTSDKTEASKDTIQEVSITGILRVGGISEQFELDTYGGEQSGYGLYDATGTMILTAKDRPEWVAYVDKRVTVTGGLFIEMQFEDGEIYALKANTISQ